MPYSIITGDDLEEDLRAAYDAFLEMPDEEIEECAPNGGILTPFLSVTRTLRLDPEGGVRAIWDCFLTVGEPENDKGAFFGEVDLDPSSEGYNEVPEWVAMIRHTWDEEWDNRSSVVITVDEDGNEAIMRDEDGDPIERGRYHWMEYQRTLGNDSTELQGTG